LVRMPLMHEILFYIVNNHCLGCSFLGGK
jgi:hypothetical protein